MKRHTIILTAIMLASAACANAASVLTMETLRNGEEVTTQYTTNKFFSFRVDADWLSNSISADEYSGFIIDSISVKAADGYSWNKNTSVVGIRKYGETATYVGISDQAVCPTEKGAYMTFSGFKDCEGNSVELETGVVYEVVFYSAGAMLKEDNTLIGSFQNPTTPLAAYSNLNLGTDDVTCGINGSAIIFREYKADIILTGTAIAIPEPSAFGLIAGTGVLALVAARRRRKAN